MPRFTLARSLYVDEQGARVGIRNGRLVVDKREGDTSITLLQLPSVAVEQVILAGNVQITTQAMKFLLHRNIEIVYLTTRGRFKGRFVPEYHKNVWVRLKQFAAHEDDQACLGLARAFVAGKLRNMRTIMMRYGRNAPDCRARQAADGLNRLIKKVAGAENLDAVRGLEGYGTRLYFEQFNGFIKRPGDGVFRLDFEGRTRRPPRDAVNALLSFGYALLTGDLVAACSVAGLDPYIGYLHRPGYGRPALALDLMEEFRPLIVDSVVLSLINKGSVTPAHFEEKLGGVFLTEAGRKAFFPAYARRKQEVVKHPLFGYELPYHRIFESQARLLAKVLTGDLPAYRAFTMK